jgi:starch synthase
MGKTTSIANSKPADVQTVSVAEVNATVSAALSALGKKGAPPKLNVATPPASKPEKITPITIPAEKPISTQIPKKDKPTSAPKPPKEKAIKEKPQIEKEPKSTSSPKLKVLFCVSEAQPYCATGGLGEVGGSLPKAIKKSCSDIDIRVMLPLYQSIPSEARDKMKFLGSTQVKRGWVEDYCGVFELKEHGIVYYFIDNEKYFKRDNLYGYDDDGQCFSFLSKACLDTFEITKFTPDIVHTNDWHTALSTVYLKTVYENAKEYAKIKSVFTLHNINFQGRFHYSYMDAFGIDYKYKNVLEYGEQLNLVKAAIECAHAFNTVSPTYAEEIKTSEFAEGLEGIITTHAKKIRGILNGIDYDFYNPKIDKELFANFDVKTLENKSANKRGVQKIFNMQVDEKIPMLLFNGRLTGQKGIDLIKEGIGEILSDRIQMVVMGDGEKRYENFFEYIEGKYQGKFKYTRYSNNLSKKLYAAADLVLMPSLFEPCGLSQMIASRYGTVPIVRETGGLKDTIRDFGCPTGGNGYTFANYSTHDLVYSVKRAVTDFINDGSAWENKMKTVTKTDFSWKQTVREYFDLYKKIKKA